MFIGAAIFLVLIVMGGIIAFLGDRIGSKVGKKRMTLFGLRPKYTSVIVTIISGVLISFSTVAVMAVVNENVRVALFGLSKLQAQMNDLNQEIKVKNRELEKGKSQLEARNKEYEDVTKKSEETSRELDRVESQRIYMERELTSVQSAYDEAQAGVEQSAQEIRDLEKTKEELNSNITVLNNEKKTLLDNIYALREGQVVMQAGQVLTSVTVDEKMTKDQSVKVLESVLNDINTMLKQQMNINDDNVDLIRVSQSDFDEAVQQLTGAKHKKLVRIVAAQNLIRGERLIVDFDIHDNLLIFNKGDVIYKGNLDAYQNIKNYELQVLRFLKDLNHYAQSKGVLPDPITGNVGVLEGQELIDVIQKVKEYGGQCELTVTARRDVYSQGPLVIDVKVERKAGGL
ncbi:DUF3084 domain-containing protein [uncultured Dialister sp.]|jgi:uncharacterized protein (DUF3084 family)|uniref:DUF3084 domain-containing protein n=1 Tax=uncultured Dialister sp. TaxID=278064 RepID=UPI0025F4B550|nr:DUF3084 domain-containing protein [uncultured Dialister sp.]